MILKKHQRNQFALIDIDVLNREDISAKAKGVLTFLMAQHPDWKPTAEAICKRMKDGPRAIHSALQELREHVYIVTGKQIGRAHV